MNKDDSLHVYLEKLLDVKGEPLTEEHLRAMALELGLTEKDFEELQEDHEQHLIRAEGYLAHENWQDAIHELEQALAIHPFRSKALLTMASAHELKWTLTRKRAALRTAISYAKKVLEQNKADPEAIAHVSRLRKLQRKHTKRWIQLAVFLSFLTFIFLIVQVQTSSIESHEGLDPALSQGTSSPSFSPANPIPVQGEALLFNEFEVPLRFSLYRAENIEWLPLTSETASRKGNFSYYFKTYVKVKEGEIKKLRLLCELVLDDETKRFEHTFTLHDVPAPMAREGDLIPFGFSHVGEGTRPENLRELRVQVADITVLPSKKEYPASLPIELGWGIPKTSDMDVKVRIRKEQYITESAYPYGLLYVEIENTGKVPIESLEIGARWYDAKNHLLQTQSFFGAYHTKPALFPGQSVVAGRSFSIPDPEADREKLILSVESYKIFHTNP